MENIRQTVIRMDEALYELLKVKARKENRSLNSLMVTILERGVGVELPRLDLADYQPDESILSLGVLLGGASQDKESLDDRAKYILDK
jgi:hypothetical protein